jgi:hypothetical protein
VLWFQGCSRCGGTLESTKGEYGSYWRCLNCGRVFEARIDPPPLPSRKQRGGSHDTSYAIIGGAETHPPSALSVPASPLAGRSLLFGVLHKVRESLPVLLCLSL